MWPECNTNDVHLSLGHLTKYSTYFHVIHTNFAAMMLSISFPVDFATKTVIWWDPPRLHPHI